MNIKKKGYQFPSGHDPDSKDRTIQNIEKRLAHAMMKNLRYDDPEKNVLGFMGTTPDEMAIQAYQNFLIAHANNIGEHTRNVDELGFAGTQQLEREVIGMMGDLYGEPFADGYLSYGGTEANIQGCWVGREYLLKEFPEHHTQNVCLLVSYMRHYSIDKAYYVLRFGPQENLVFLPMNNKGEVSVSAMEQCIESMYLRGERKFIIVAIAGTTLLGTIDDMQAVGDMVERLYKKYNQNTSREDYIGIYVHIDAAFGGFIAPFLNPPIKIGFQAHKSVCSMTVDPHKMGLTPYPSGAFLCRNGLIEVVKTSVGYVGGHHNVTIAGSRPGASAAACWAAFHKLGKKAYQYNARRCMEVLERFRSYLGNLNGITMYPHTMNILAFSISHPRVVVILDKLTELEMNGLKYDDQLPSSIQGSLRRDVERYRKMQIKYVLVSSSVPSDLSCLESPPHWVIRFVFMPHRWLLENGEKVASAFFEEFKTLFQ